MGGDEGRTDVGKICPHGLGCQHGGAIGNGAAERERPVKPFTNLLDQGKRTLDTGMASCTGRDSNQAVGTLGHGLAGEGVADHIMQNDAAVTVHLINDVLPRAERSDDHRHFVALDQRHVVIQPVIALVHDLVDGTRRGRPLRLSLVVVCQRLRDLGQPFVKLGCGSGVERRHRADHAGLALRDHERRIAHDEHRRGDDGQRQVAQCQG